jgi:hypothetical protein
MRFKTSRDGIINSMEVGLTPEQHYILIVVGCKLKAGWCALELHISVFIVHMMNVYATKRIMSEPDLL